MNFIRKCPKCGLTPGQRRAKLLSCLRDRMGVHAEQQGVKMGRDGDYDDWDFDEEPEDY